MSNPGRFGRRQALQALAAATLAPVLASAGRAAAEQAPDSRAVPTSGERLPLIGLGSWITFNVGNDRAARAACAEVMRSFFRHGGRLIDSSPMYGSSQDVIGAGLADIGMREKVFSADKVWTGLAGDGPAQVERSRRLWRVARFDLLQVHNLLAWQEHLPMLFAMKAAGRLRYVGVTTSHGRRHRELEQIMIRHPLDFVQLTYNLVDREAEHRLLPLAQEKGIAVIANRPFRQGELLQALARQPLPPWAADIDCGSWAQLALKFVVSHPAVTCAIPATSQVAHVIENMGAARGRQPDAALRRRLAALAGAL